MVLTSSGLTTVASSHVLSNMRLGSGWMLHTEHACPTFHSLLGVRNGTRPVTSSPCWSSMVQFVALDTTEHKERRHRRMKGRKGERSGRAGVVMAVAHRQRDSNSQHTYAPRAPPDHMERDHCHGVVYYVCTGRCGADVQIEPPSRSSQQTTSYHLVDEVFPPTALPLASGIRKSVFRE
jgi:hypothetical protein